MSLFSLLHFFEAQCHNFAQAGLEHTLVMPPSLPPECWYYDMVLDTTMPGSSFTLHLNPDPGFRAWGCG